MIKLLITGFRHSGTTMLLQLIRSHPQVGWIENEESYIEFDKPKDWILGMASLKVPNLKENVWGEKIPWETRETDKNAQRAIKFSKRWLKFFGKDARVLQILRHPLDVHLSGKMEYKVDLKEFKFMLNSIEKYIDFINNDKRCATIIYENLVINPEIYLPKIFHFLNLSVNKKIINKVLNTPLKFGKINSSRAFNYKEKGIKFNVNYDALINRIGNEI